MEGKEVDWDTLTKVGHDFTLVDGPSAGKYIYYCEHCAALMMISGGGIGTVEIWYHPERIDYMCNPKSNRVTESLSTKIKNMNIRSIEKLSPPI